MARPTDDNIARAGTITPSGVTSIVAARDDELIGTVIDGRYRLDALVGRGGMGVVYKAEHVAIRRVVALKLLHPGLAGIPELRSRFEREALAIGRIAHPNCVDVSDFGRLDDGSLFLVMEYLDGRPLGEVLEEEHHLRPRRALRILRHVLAGLGHAHTAGIVHRDIKPDNVFLARVGDGDGEIAKILDFGIAKVIAGERGAPEDDVKLTQAGVAFGTPVYMSPEQALGSPVDGRADLYAASVMAYEMLTGRPPFFSDDKLEVMSMHTTREPPPMDVMLADAGYPGATVPAAVEELIRRGLTKKPIDRWASAEAYTSALDEVLLELALDAAPDATPTPLPEPRTHTGHTGEHPLITTTGSSLIRARSSLGTAPAAPAEPQLSMPVPLIARKPTTGKRARRPLLIFAAGAVLAVGAAIAIVVAMSGGGDADDRPAPSPVASRAAAELDHGNPGAAIKTLEAEKDRIAKDPSAQLQLGHAYAAKRDNGPAVEAYRRAIALAPASADDPDLRANLRAISDDKDTAAAMAAFELLIGPAHDPTAADRLIAAASSATDGTRRAGAVALARRRGLDGKVDWLTSYSLDLDQGATCDERKDAVSHLRALGDPRAIPALEAAVARRKAGKHGKLVNTCLIDDAKAALVYLRSLPAGHP